MIHASRRQANDFGIEWPENGKKGVLSLVCDVLSLFGSLNGPIRQDGRETFGAVSAAETKLDVFTRCTVTLGSRGHSMRAAC